MPKNFLIIAILILGFGSVVFAAPYYTSTRTQVPESDNAFDLGTTTARYRTLYAVIASTTNFNVTNATTTGRQAAGYFVATNANATSTLTNAYVTGNLQVDGYFFAPVTLVTSGNATINGTLNVTGLTTLGNASTTQLSVSNTAYFPGSGIWN